MPDAYQQLVEAFRAMAYADIAFQTAKKNISSLPETKATYSFSHFCDFTVGGTNSTGTSWEIETAAMREGTEARWHLENELMHSTQSCELSADAGFRGKYGPMVLREIGPVTVADLNDFGTEVEGVLENLFGDLDRDCKAAIKADREEMESLERERGKTSSEPTLESRDPAAN